ncbi:GAF domain-containing protein [Subsaxibacter sp. CAU 1640]|uniref:GAF domain-containing protein n=1 Tax=Subsaxibacter sp. CAU 1640 TaxID=2933271 RepID=UPI002005F7C0|nr:GAF domain-containing protein [Subsaxibacter sp. CAU 1640]MCK7589044.1 GAF domain-containing protein [Subsaxibacter sp. CAU 1640]
MKDLNDNIESPFTLKVSFDKLLQHYELLAESDDNFTASKAKEILSIQKEIPVLRNGFSDVSLLKTYEKEIHFILQDLFSPVLATNEIKTASVPYHDLIFNSSERFRKIIKNAGEDYSLTIKNMPEDDKYRVACVIILNFYYGYKVDFKRPFFYEIPDINGVLHTYKILYNADFTEIVRTEDAPEITEDDFNELLDAFDDMELWKEKFPPNSYIFKGFVISNMFDVTDDKAISEIKSSLLVSGKRQDENFIGNLQTTFESLFNIKGLNVGFVIYNEEDQVFERIVGKGIESYLLFHEDMESCKSALCDESYKALIDDNTFFCISDVEKYYGQSGCHNFYKIFHDQGIKSAILAPIANQGKLLGVLEIVSKKPKQLNSVNANKLTDVMPYIVSSVLRSKAEEENLIEAIIQQECTSIHPSVVWKFKEAARKFVKDQRQFGSNVAFSKIGFENVYPLFGQIDVKGSSDARNLATQKDLSLQLNLVSKIMDQIIKEDKLLIYEQLKFQLDTFKKELDENFKVDSEHEITSFLKKEVEPVLKFLMDKKLKAKDAISDYFSKIDSNLNVIYYYRKNYDDTIALINKNMSSLIDSKQVEAQKMYPHYFERYKTDGVEHNMYIGEAITKEESFNEIYLYNLRLWQLQVMCEMESEYYQNMKNYPISLDVASMILVFNQPMSIHFRMDEKQFDVNGTYNARYEVVKKRVDKAFIKGTKERITEKGKISIIYSQKADEEEYLRYIKFLQSKHVLDEQIELVELEDLQGVTGLKAIRVPILYHSKGEEEKFYTYDDLINELKA